MSIEIETPVTPLEKADALNNLVQQMFIAHQVGDEQMFRTSHGKASQIGFDLVEALQDNSGLTQRAADGAKRRPCKLCHQTDHDESDCGLVLPNPPRR